MTDPARVHEPVMVTEVLELLSPADHSAILDLTLGAGGHAQRILESTTDGIVIGFDRDPQILELARTRLEGFGDRIHFANANFDRIELVCAQMGLDQVDGALLDLGVSSLQLDDAQRGFSFGHDGPLDMRMTAGSGRSAAELINRGTREELFHAIGTLGDEPRARRVVEAILEARRVAPLRRTCELADLVASVTRGPRHHHPATRTFLGLRMAVNDEAGAIERALPDVIHRLKPGAVAAVIAFHGGEDRIVKQCFRTAAKTGIVAAVTTRPLTPSGAETKRNPRARSARIRAIRKLGAAVGPGHEKFAGGGGTS